ncbi:MAG: cysteine desulfurase family protein [Spirochaetota bacterium]
MYAEINSTNPENTVYLDWAATAVPEQHIIDRVHEVSLQYFGNPSSIHTAGRRAEKILEQARQNIARVVGCREDEVIFTSGATESNNMVLFSLLHKKKPGKVILSGIEHSSVHGPAKKLQQFGFKVLFVPAEKNGRINPEKLGRSLDKDTVLVCLMLVNNETGAFQPVAEAAAMVENFSSKLGRKIPVHTDAVQALGKVPVNFKQLGVDSASLSSHKIGGPRGAGALYLRHRTYHDFLYTGGGQEQGMRPGTENTPGIYGFSMGALNRSKNIEDQYRKSMELMNYLVSGLNEIEGARILPKNRINESDQFSPCIVKVAFPPVPGEVLVRVLEKNGVMVSTGSACSSRKKDRTRVLKNMGISEQEALSSIRISTGWKTTRQEADKLLEVLKQQIPGLVKIAR